MNPSVRFQQPFERNASQQNVNAFVGGNGSTRWSRFSDQSSARESTSSLIASPNSTQNAGSRTSLLMTANASNSSLDGANEEPTFTKTTRKRKSIILASPEASGMDHHSYDVPMRQRHSVSFQQQQSNTQHFASLYSATHESGHNVAPVTDMPPPFPHRGKLKRPPLEKTPSRTFAHRFKKRLRKALSPKRFFSNFGEKMAKFDTVLPFVTLLPDVVTLLLAFGVLQWKGFGANYEEVPGCTNVLHVGIVILLQGYLSSLSILSVVVAPLIVVNINPSWNHRGFRAVVFAVLSLLLLLRLPLVVTLQVFLSKSHCGPRVSYFWLALVVCLSMWVNVIWGVVCWIAGMGVRVWDIAHAMKKVKTEM